MSAKLMSFYIVLAWDLVLTLLPCSPGRWLERLWQQLFSYTLRANPSFIMQTVVASVCAGSERRGPLDGHRVLGNISV